MADVTSGETLAVIGSALTVIATVAQGVWANHKGKKREPRQGRMEGKLDELVAKVEANTAKIDQLKEHFDQRHNTLGARIERVERAQRKSGAPLDDTEAGDQP